MTDVKYEELQMYIKSIPKFKKLVSSESKRRVAVNLVKHIANVDSSTAWDFVTEYYSRMDINILQSK